MTKTLPYDSNTSRYGQLLCVFDYFTSSGSGDIFSLQYNSWTDLMLSTFTAHGESHTCRPDDCDIVFKATNFEEVGGVELDGTETLRFVLKCDHDC